MNQSEKINLLKKVVTNLSTAFDDLKNENMKMRVVLRDLAVGLAPVDLPKTWDHATKLEHVAATALMNRKEIKKPSCLL
jgi:hypothetical protein